MSLLAGCMPDEEIYTGKNPNAIQVACGKSCQTIVFAPGSAELSPSQRYLIRRFVHRTRHHQPIFISPCATNRTTLGLSEWRIHAVKKEVIDLCHTPVRLKQTLPRDLLTRNCVNLVRGKLHLFVQKCPNCSLAPSVQNVGSSFGCTTNYNLAVMIINPWNLLATSGDNGTEGDRVALGSKDYREGKVSKLDMESSS